MVKRVRHVKTTQCTIFRLNPWTTNWIRRVWSRGSANFGTVYKLQYHYWRHGFHLKILAQNESPTLLVASLLQSSPITCNICVHKTTRCSCSTVHVIIRQ